MPKGYLYFAMAFSAFVEMPDLRQRKRMEARRGQGGSWSDSEDKSGGFEAAGNYSK